VTVAPPDADAQARAAVDRVNIRQLHDPDQRILARLADREHDTRGISIQFAKPRLVGSRGDRAEGRAQSDKGRIVDPREQLFPVALAHRRQHYLLADDHAAP
jgi:hypothetical protein